MYGAVTVGDYEGESMKQKIGITLAGLLVAGMLLPTGSFAQSELTEQRATAKFSEMVLRYHRHLDRSSPGGATCEPVSTGGFSCKGRWKTTAVKYASQIRTRFVFVAEGEAFGTMESLKTWARMKRWEIVRGVKNGPIEGTVLKASWPL